MIDPVGAVRSQVSSTLFGYISGKFGLIICVLLQQSTSESKPSEAGQLFDPQKWLLWHSLLESQSPSFSTQGIPDAQKCSSPRVGW